MEKCVNCSSEATLQHHVNYFEDETVPMCNSCHARVHNNPESFPDLQPVGSREDIPRKRTVEVTLDESDIKRVEKVKEEMGTTSFSEALRFIIKTHKYIFGERIILPDLNAYRNLLEVMEEE